MVSPDVRDITSHSAEERVHKLKPTEMALKFHTGPATNTELCRVGRVHGTSSLLMSF